MTQTDLSARILTPRPLHTAATAPGTHLVLDLRARHGAVQRQLFGVFSPEQAQAIDTALEATSVRSDEGESEADAHEALWKLLRPHGLSRTGEVMDWQWVDAHSAGQAAGGVRLLELGGLPQPLARPVGRPTQYSGAQPLYPRLKGQATTVHFGPELYELQLIVSGAAPWSRTLSERLSGDSAQHDVISAPQVLLVYPDSACGGELSVFTYPSGDIGLCVPGADPIDASRSPVTTPQVITTDGRSGHGLIHLDPHLFGESVALLQALQEFGWVQALPKPGHAPTWVLTSSGKRLPRAQI